MSPARRRPLVVAAADEIPPATSQPLGGAAKRGVTPEDDAAAAASATAASAAAADTDAAETAAPCNFCGGAGQVTCPVCDGEGYLGRTIGCRYCRGACILKCPLCAVTDMYKWTYDEVEEGAAAEGMVATTGRGRGTPATPKPIPGSDPNAPPLTEDCDLL